MLVGFLHTVIRSELSGPDEAKVTKMVWIHQCSMLPQ